uniref:Uncharacterized protein n=1 Tax=Anguilla anguilla TaxID=7936 RepID=A0A0E9XWM5_ANGAN
MGARRRPATDRWQN